MPHRGDPLRIRPIVAAMRTMPWPDRHDWYNRIYRRDWRIADLIAQRMGPDELLEGQATGSKPIPVIALPGRNPLVLPDVFGPRRRQITLQEAFQPRQRV